MSELKPCPFCGGDSVTLQSLGGHTRAGCVDCGAEVTRPMGLYRNAMIEWNTRPIEDELTARIAELEGFIDRLVEAGDAVCDAYPAYISPIGKWDSLVKDWKEREE
jgi:hypothetical protein